MFSSVTFRCLVFTFLVTLATSDENYDKLIDDLTDRTIKRVSSQNNFFTSKIIEMMVEGNTYQNISLHDTKVFRFEEVRRVNDIKKDNNKSTKDVLVFGWVGLNLPNGFDMNGTLTFFRDGKQYDADASMKYYVRPDTRQDMDITIFSLVYNTNTKKFEKMVLFGDFWHYHYKFQLKCRDPQSQDSCDQLEKTWGDISYMFREKIGDTLKNLMIG